jgi:hypothetical protein
MEGLHSVAPSMTTEAQGSLVPSREHRYSSSTDAQGIVAATPGVVCQAPQLSAAKSMEPEISAPRSMAPYLSPPRSMAHHLRGKAFRELGAPRSMAPHPGSAPRSMAPQLRGKMPEVPAKITMPEAHHSSAANVVPVIFEPLSSSPLPKEKSVVTSRNECLTPSSARQGPDCPSNLATAQWNTPSQSMQLENMFLHALHDALFLYSLKHLNCCAQRMWLQSIQQHNVEKTRTSPEQVLMRVAPSRMQQVHSSNCRLTARKARRRTKSHCFSDHVRSETHTHMCGVILPVVMWICT